MLSPVRSDRTSRAQSFVLGITYMSYHIYTWIFLDFTWDTDDVEGVGIFRCCLSQPDMWAKTDEAWIDRFRCLSQLTLWFGVTSLLFVYSVSDSPVSMDQPSTQLCYPPNFGAEQKGSSTCSPLSCRQIVGANDNTDANTGV